MRAKRSKEDETTQPGTAPSEARHGPTRGTNPDEMMDWLGAGRLLDGASGSRIAHMYGISPGDVRIHTDARGQELARQQGAQAVTLGSHIAFAPGRYRPGTLLGDALLAHELAHAAQQQNSQSGSTWDQSGSAHYEHDANRAAGGAILRLHGLTHGAQTSASQRPVQRSGLALRRCDPEPPTKAQLDALSAEMDAQIGPAKWETVRHGILDPMDVAARERDEQRRARGEDLTGLGAQPVLKRIAAGIREVQTKKWEGAKSTSMRAHLIRRVINKELTGPSKHLGIPQLIGLEDPDMTELGHMDRKDWQIVLRKDFFTQPTLSDEDALELVALVMHETRHAEQATRVARSHAGAGMDQGDIATEMKGISPKVAKAAVEKPLTAANSTAEERNEVAIWAGDVRHYQRVGLAARREIEALKKLGKEAELALEAVKRDPTGRKYQAALLAHRRLQAQVPKTQAAYRAYLALETEKDSREVGQAARMAFKRLL